MRFLLPWIAAAVVLCANAQSPGATAAEDPDVIRAKAGIERLRALVEAGALPRMQLERAEEGLADARDMAVLRRTMYSRDLTEEQADEMLAAAQRRSERRQKQLERARGMVAAGVSASGELQVFLEEADFARKEYDLAATRAKLCHDLGEMARAEQIEQAHAGAANAQTAGRYDGDGVFTPADFREVAAAFERRFAKALPVSAMGETAVHRALGFDHRDRVDVALSPDQPEGEWLLRHLEARRIPYFAFRQAVPGKATGAHIHMGPMSTRLSLAGHRPQGGARGLHGKVAD